MIKTLIIIIKSVNNNIKYDKNINNYNKNVNNNIKYDKNINNYNKKCQ